MQLVYGTPPCVNTEDFCLPSLEQVFRPLDT